MHASSKGPGKYASLARTCGSRQFFKYNKVARWLISFDIHVFIKLINEPVHEISNNVVCATSKASDQPAHTRSLIRAFASRLSIL